MAPGLNRWRRLRLEIRAQRFCEKGLGLFRNQEIVPAARTINSPNRVETLNPPPNQPLWLCRRTPSRRRRQPPLPPAATALCRSPPRVPAGRSRASSRRRYAWAACWTREIRPPPRRRAARRRRQLPAPFSDWRRPPPWPDTDEAQWLSPARSTEI
jgi:hypothetical protein